MENNEIAKRKLTLDDMAHEENGVGFWYAREIMPVFGYSQWRRFEEANQGSGVTMGVFGRIESQPNIAGYVEQLVRDDMARAEGE